MDLVALGSCWRVCSDPIFASAFLGCKTARGRRDSGMFGTSSGIEGISGKLGRRAVRI